MGPSWTVLIGHYVSELVAGKNIKRTSISAQTIREYVDTINALFTSRGFPQPADWDVPSCVTALYSDVKTWENEPNRRTHMQPTFLSTLVSLASKDKEGLSFQAAICDWALLGRFTAFRLAEYGQSTQSKVGYHTTAFGKKIMKAMCRLDFAFYDIHGHRILNPHKVDPPAIHKVTITWRVQKNRRNNQKVYWVADPAFATLCAVRGPAHLLPLHPPAP